MMNEEKYFKEQMGSKNPFTVPEGYFEQLSDRIICRLPADEEQSAATHDKQPAFMRRLRPWLAAASVAAVAVISATLFFGKSSDDMSQRQEDEAMIAYNDGYNDNDTYAEEEADYAMVDNQDIYAFLLAEI